MWNLTAAVALLDSQKLPSSHGLCALYTRQAIEAGGVTLARHADAKDYGSSLLAVGFGQVAGPAIVYKAGDVGIVQPVTGHPDGHMAMYDGTHWISDFMQLYGLYPGSQYRLEKPPFAIYRYPVS